MSESTLDSDMPRQTPPDVPCDDALMEYASKLKLFQSDHELAAAIAAETSDMFRTTMQDILRDAIHAGLPIVSKKFRAAVEAAKKSH